MCHWAFFLSVLALSWNRPGLFLSALIRGSRLHPSLITPLRANIPFIFSLFRPLSPFVVGRLGKRCSNLSTYQRSPFFLVLQLFDFCFPFLFPSLHQSQYFKSPTCCCEWLRTPNTSRDHVYSEAGKISDETFSIDQLLASLCVLLPQGSFYKDNRRRVQTLHTGASYLLSTVTNPPQWSDHVLIQYWSFAFEILTCDYTIFFLYT